MICVATKSILKTVHIKDSKSASKLAGALENSQTKRQKDFKPSRQVSEASREEIKSMFGKQ